MPRDRRGLAVWWALLARTDLREQRERLERPELPDLLA